MLKQLDIKNRPVISTAELNKVLDFQKLNGDDDILIMFSNEIIKIDIVFIAGIILLSKQANKKFDIDYRGKCDNIFEVRHYLKQFQNLYGGDWKDFFISIKGIQYLSEADL